MSAPGAAASVPAWRRAAAALLAVLPALALAAEQHPFADAPYVPTPEAVVDAMLELARVGPEDFVVDLGSGDGRIVIAAAKRRGARGLGVEIEGALVEEARREARRQGVAERVEFRAEDLFQTDIGRATVVTLYLFSGLMERLRPRLTGSLKPGTRVVSHEFDMGGWEPDARVTVPVPDRPYGAPYRDVMMWIVPADARGVWRWRLVAGGTTTDHEITLSQDFQKLRGGPTVESGVMKGEEIRFVLASSEAGRALRHEYRGRVSGDSIRGMVRLPGGEELPWSATRVRRDQIQ